MRFANLVVFCFTCFTLTLFSASSSKEKKVNIGVFIAKERGGTGDITSNLLAAMQLKAAHPEWNVFLVEPSTQRSVKVLRSVLPESEQDELLGDIQLLSREEFQKRKLKKCDDINIALQFSAPVITNDTKAKGWADQTWIFTEFSIPFWMGPESHNELSLSKVAKRFNTGPESLGIYIGRKQPKAPMNLTELKKRLSQLEDKSVVPAMVTGRKRQIAYSYATHYSNTKKYVDFVYQAARTRYANERIQLIVYDSDRGNVRLYAKDKPENVDLVVLHKRPLSLGIGIMSQATLPMLLTGDLGPALAIEYNKPFFMETHEHKIDFRAGLIDKLKPYLTSDNVQKLRRAWDFTMLKSNRFDLMTDTELWNQLHNGVENFRKTASLVENIADYITSNEEQLQCSKSLIKVDGKGR